MELFLRHRRGLESDPMMTKFCRVFDHTMFTMVVFLLVVLTSVRPTTERERMANVSLVTNQFRGR